MELDRLGELEQGELLGRVILVRVRVYIVPILHNIHYGTAFLIFPEHSHSIERAAEPGRRFDCPRASNSPTWRTR